MRYPTRRDRLRHKLVSEWRGVEDGPLQDLPALSIESLVPKVLKTWKLDDRLHAEEMGAAWKEIVGDFIATYTSPDGVKRGVLVINISQSAIHHTLMMKKADILSRLQKRFGAKTIKDIRFRHG